VADELTTTAYNDIVNATIVEPVFIAALCEQAGLWALCREFNLIGRGTSALGIPKGVSFVGTPDDSGASIDTELDATEGTDISNTASTTSTVSLTTGEYAIAMEVTDTLKEDTVSGLDLFGILSGGLMNAIGMAMEVDFLALLASLSNVTGTSGVNISIANMIAAQSKPRRRGARGDAQVYILDSQQGEDLDNELVAGSAAAATFALAADRALGYAPTNDNGMMTMETMRFRNRPVFVTGLTPTANSGADVVGASIYPSTPFNDRASVTTFGMAWARRPRLETARVAIGRSDQLVASLRAGFVELQDGSGENLTTDF
jgi:hypothetical protein